MSRLSLNARRLFDRLRLASLVLGSLLAWPSVQAQAPMPGLPTVPTAPNPALPLPDGLVPQVEFWKMVYSRLSKDEVVFHDNRRMDVIYDTYDVPEALTPGAEISNQNYLRAIRSRYQAIFDALAEGSDPDTLSGEALRLYELWGPTPTPGTFAAAAENLRAQRGLRERFIQGLAFSGRYQAHVEQIFREEGVPLELTFLPFVESMYNIAAYSKVGAAGVWQFMPGTGRLFMRVDGTLDERMDPIRAARAASRLLRRNYDKLGTWPLAITAYNHGPYGMANAVRVMGTRDIERIVRGYDGRAFGFASRNFYTEFLAALEVRRNFREHFGDVRMDPAMEFQEVVLPAPARFSTLARALEVPVQALWEINPAVTPRTRSQDRALPAGYVLRVPVEAADEWDDAVEAILYRPEPVQLSSGRDVERGSRGTSSRRAGWYVVRRGDTLGAIADRAGVSLTELRRVNGLGKRSLIRPGQRLKLPG
jgi:membrane-bound lytic murein transglycosylase D